MFGLDFMNFSVDDDKQEEVYKSSQPHNISITNFNVLLFGEQYQIKYNLAPGT